MESKEVVFIVCRRNYCNAEAQLLQRPIARAEGKGYLRLEGLLFETEWSSFSTSQ